MADWGASWRILWYFLTFVISVISEIVNQGAKKSVFFCWYLTFLHRHKNAWSYCPSNYLNKECFAKRNDRTQKVFHDFVQFAWFWLVYSRQKAGKKLHWETSNSPAGRLESCWSWKKCIWVNLNNLTSILCVILQSVYKLELQTNYHQSCCHSIHIIRKSKRTDSTEGKICDCICLQRLCQEISLKAMLKWYTNVLWSSAIRAILISLKIPSEVDCLKLAYFLKIVQSLHELHPIKCICVEFFNIKLSALFFKCFLSFFHLNNIYFSLCFASE